jgi:hypothetical protein
VGNRFGRVGAEAGEAPFTGLVSQIVFLAPPLQELPAPLNPCQAIEGHLDSHSGTILGAHGA